MAHPCKKPTSRVKPANKRCPDCTFQRLTMEHTVIKELESASDLIASLRSAKRSLKESLQTAFDKCEDMNSKLANSTHSLKSEIKRRKAAENELKAARSQISDLDKQLSECKALMSSREAEAKRLERKEKGNREACIANLEASIRDLKAEANGLRQSQEEHTRFVDDVKEQIGKYSSFIGSKLAKLPEYDSIFKGRFKSLDELNALEDKRSLIKVLKFLGDLIFFETRNRLTPLKREQCSQALETSYDEASGAHLRSFDKSNQTLSDKATDTLTKEELLKELKPLSSPKPRPRPISFDKDSSFSKVYKPPYSSPKAARTQSLLRETSFDVGLNDTSGLIDALSMQNDKLSRLNQQIAETMASSRNLLNSSLTLDHSRPTFRGPSYETNPFDIDEPEIHPSSKKMNRVLSDRDLAIPTQLDLRLIADALQGSMSSPRVPSTDRSSDGKHFTFQVLKDRQARRTYKTEPDYMEKK